jgi:hypothetical protein
MLTKRLHFTSLLAAFAVIGLAGCPATHTAPPDADADAAIDAGPPVVTGSQPLASACLANSDCSTGFCVDGVCCDSACRDQCYSCAQTAAVGHCGPQTDGPDSNSSVPCVGANACFRDQATHLSTCKVVDGATCNSDQDCGSGHCTPYYLDGDGDGYGTAVTAKFCAELDGQAPAGYSAYTGDCCDLDSGANPAFDSTTFLEFPDACGSFDWNCNGVVAPQHTSGCGSAGPTACGAPCVINFGFGTVTAYTQACN